MDKRAKDTLIRHQDADFSSMDPSDVKQAHIQYVVADPEWQQIRTKLKGTWNKTPNTNLLILQDYLGDGKNPWKVRRLLNYLTGSGFRIGIIKNFDELTEFTEKVRNIWKKMTT